MREASYGHATLDFESSTAATFRWHRNQVCCPHQALQTLRLAVGFAFGNLALVELKAKPWAARWNSPAPMLQDGAAVTADEVRLERATSCDGQRGANAAATTTTALRQRRMLSGV